MFNRVFFVYQRVLAVITKLQLEGLINQQTYLGAHIAGPMADIPLGNQTWLGHR